MYEPNINDSVLTEAGLRKFISLPTPAARVLLPPISSANDLIANESLLEPTELVKGFLHRGTKAILGGCSKTRKTWMLLDLAVAVATGRDFFDYHTNQGKVLFINLELQPAFIRQRLRKLRERRGITALDDLDVWNLRGQSLEADKFLPAMADRLRNAGYCMIVIDPIYKLMVGRSESSGLGVGLLCHDIERLVEKSAASVVYAHHFTKGNQSAKKAMDRMSGSGVFARDADTIITLTEHQLKGCFSVEIAQRNMASPEPFVVEWEYPVMVVRSDLDPADLDDGKRQDEHQVSDFLLSLLRDHPLSATAWQTAAQSVGISRTTFYRRIEQLKENGEVKHDPFTKVWYRPTQLVSCGTSGTSGTPAPVPATAPEDRPPMPAAG